MSLANLMNSYTFALLGVRRYNANGSETEKEVALAEGIRCHFRLSSGVVRISPVAQKDPYSEWKIIYADTAVKCTIWDYVVLYEGKTCIGKYMIDGVNENRMTSGRLDSIVLSVHQTENGKRYQDSCGWVA